MTALDNLIMWLAVLALGAVADWLWTRRVRPFLADRLGLERMDEGDLIPPLAWLGVAAVTAVFGFFSYAGALVGLS